MEAAPAAASSLIRRLWGWVRRHWIITSVGLAVAIGLGIWLIFFYFAVHLLWVDDEVDEALPVFGEPGAAEPAPTPEPILGEESPAPATEVPPVPPVSAEGSSPAPVNPTTTPPAEPPPVAAGQETPAPSTDPATADTPAASASQAEGPMVAGPGASGLPGDEITEEMADEMNQAVASGEMPREVVMNEERPMPRAPQIVTLVSGEFISRSHHTEGRVQVLNDGSEQRFLRFEDFRTDNGPDVDVWLSPLPPDAPARDILNDWINLGDLKGNVGSQNYEIPPSVDLDHYSTVVVWCVRFSVPFGAAALS